MDKAERQAALNTVVAHLKKQGQRAGQPGNCMYRKGKLKCAIGALIPDALYDPCIEEQNIRAIFEADVRDFSAELEIKKHLKLDDVEDESFLTALQEFHDIYWEPEEPLSADVNRQQLEHIAERFLLEVPS